MTRTLLAATDFSAPARHALERAALIAQAHPGAHLTLAHVVSVTLLDQVRHLLPADTGSLASTLLAEAEARLAETAAALASRHAGPIDALVVQGTATDALPVLAEARQTDLLVLGAHGVHFVRELLLGSTVERVLRKSRRPLLAVKQRAQAPYRRILAAVDFSPHAAAAINTAHAWLPDAEIVLLHAFDVEFESTLRFAGMDDGRINAYRLQAREAAQARMEAFVAALDVPADRLTREFVHGAPSIHIIEYEQNLDADLIVMGKRGLSVIEELLLGSVTQHVLTYSSCDVFIACRHPADPI